MNLSHRARGLLLFGVIWVMVGFATLLGDTTEPRDAYPLALFSPEVQAVIWLVTGTAAVVASVLASAHEATKWVFVGLLIPAALRCLSFAWSAVLSLATYLGQESAWIGAVTWAVVIGFVLHEASTPEIPEALVEPEARR